MSSWDHYFKNGTGPAGLAPISGFLSQCFAETEKPAMPDQFLQNPV